MDGLIVALQVVLGLGILNVWILRFSKSTAWRGGAATNMKEEFAAYGLPPWFMGVIGTLKVACALALLAGVWIPVLVQPAAATLAVLMLGAVVMHVKITDPVRRSVPALMMLAGCLAVLGA